MRALGATVGKGTYTSAIFFTEDSIACGRISLGRSSSLYPRSTVSGSVRLEEGAVHDTLSTATNGLVLGAWERWSRSPAKCTGVAEDCVLTPKMYAHSEFLLTFIQVVDVLHRLLHGHMHFHVPLLWPPHLPPL